MRLTATTRALLIALVAAASLYAAPDADARRTVVQKKHIALEQFQKAERMREALQGKKAKARARDDYTQVLNAYRRVVRIAPTSSKADESILAEAELLVEYGRAFHVRQSFHSAINQYEFLRREYPGSRYRFEALFATGQIYREDLGDNDLSRQAFEEFLKRYPRHDLAEQAKDAIAEMDQEAKAAQAEAAKAKSAKAAIKKPVRSTKATTPGETLKSRTKSAQQRDDARDAGQRASEVGAKNSRVADVSNVNELGDAEVASPDSPASSGAGGDVSAKIVKTESTNDAARGKQPLVTGIRFWSTPDYTRVVIDVEDDVKYEAGRVPSPDRIFFDLHNTRLASELVGKSFEVGDGFLRKVRVAHFNSSMSRIVLEVNELAEYSAFLLPDPYRLVIDIHGKQPATAVARSAKVKSESQPASKSALNQIGAGDGPKTELARNSVKVSLKDSASGVSNTPPKEDVEIAGEFESNGSESQPDATKELTRQSPVNNRKLNDRQVKSTTKPTSAPTFDSVAPRNKRGKAVNEVAEIREAQPTASGERSLVRALGLKVGKIVVDAGHGGHDTGTIGPNGLMEKDLVLDIALRLGKLLESKLGAEVVYTREDDTFIPLETRTAVANQQQADLFISVHANSSRDKSARGVETYYLNFTSNADALEVAARENAVSQKSVFELQDLVKKIALKDKIEESREFASDVQTALYTGLSSQSRNFRNRGVKKAPFVVLIGANMPSILAEISFVSNPNDERKLKTPEYRQKIAENLYRGISHYASGLSSVKIATRTSDTAGK